MAGEEEEVLWFRDGEKKCSPGEESQIHRAVSIQVVKKIIASFAPLLIFVLRRGQNTGRCFPFRKFSKTPSWKVEILSSCLGSRRFFIRTKWKKSRNARETHSIFFNVRGKIDKSSRDKSLDRTSSIIGILVSRDLYFIGDVDFRLVSRNGWAKFVRRKFNQLDNSRMCRIIFLFFCENHVTREFVDNLEIKILNIKEDVMRIIL